MDKRICKNCVHFCQHYALDQRKIFRVYCGHCTLRRARKRQPDAVACEFFSSAPPDEYAFATKEYLSKELVQYLLRLELLPEIRDLEEKDLKELPGRLH